MTLDTKIHEPEVTESNEHEIRLSKVKKMQEEGINPWPAFKHDKRALSSIQESLDAFAGNQDTEKTYELSGRLMSRRDHGKTFFCNLQDRSNKIQLYIK